MTLDETLASDAVSADEIEGARFAEQSVVLRNERGLLPTNLRSVPLPRAVDAGEQPAFLRFCHTIIQLDVATVWRHSPSLIPL